MRGELGKKLESKINGKLLAKLPRGGLKDGFKGNKVVNEVLDRPTVMTLFGMISSGVISGVNGAVKAGKESVVFWGVGRGGGDVALKIYLVSTSNFKNRAPYLRGDPRFAGARTRGTRNLVHLWARKEFANLSKCRLRGVPVPKPAHVANNVLAMEFVGGGGSPSPTLLESRVDMGDYRQAVGILKKMYREARLVHGDMSEYNIFKTGSGLVAFDLGSAVDVAHPRSGEFLRRDIGNITRFFVRRGLTVESAEDVYGSVVSGEL